MAELSALKAKRRSAKGWLTRAVEACDDLKKDLATTPTVSKEKFEFVCSQLDKKLAAWEKSQEAVEVMLTDAEYEVELEAAAKFKNEIMGSRLSLLF